MNPCRCGMKAPEPVLVDIGSDSYLMKCAHTYCPVSVKRVGRLNCIAEWNGVVTDYEWEYNRYNDAQKCVYDLVHEGKSVSDIKQAIKSKGLPACSYDNCVKSGHVAYWRAQKAKSIKKVLLRKDGVLIELISAYIGSGDAFYSYVYLYFEGKYVAHKPLFNPSKTAQASLDRAQNSITDDVGLLLSQLISMGKSSVCNVLSELRRI
jgi:hypothetical protein